MDEDLIKKPECVVCIGRVVLEDSDFSGVITRSAIKRPDSAEFRLAKGSPRTRLVALTDPVVIRVANRVLFRGDVIEVHVPPIGVWRVDAVVEDPTSGRRYLKLSRRTGGSTEFRYIAPAGFEVLSLL